VLNHYLSVALRNARSAPFVFAMNALTLAIGLACFVTVYAFATFWDRAEQHFADADRIAVLTTSLNLADNSFSYEDAPSVPAHMARYVKEDFPAVEKIARAYGISEEEMIATGERALRSYGMAADPEFLELFELPFIAGDARTALRNPRSVVLTKAHAAQLFGDQDPMGRSLIVGNVVDVTVTGVLDTIPEPSHLGRSTSANLGFDWLASFDVLETIRAANAPPGAPQGQPENWLQGGTVTYLLLPADGSFTIADLRAQLPDFTRRRVPAEMSAFVTLKHGAVPVRDLLGNAVDGGLFLEDAGMSVPLLLLVLGAMVLAVACVNYANLATARAARRTREVGLRKALGARRAQVALQYLLEAGVLTAVALVVALGVFLAARPLLARIMGADVAPALFSGAQIWVFLAVVIAGVTFAAGAYPALALSRVLPVRALRSSRQQVGSKVLSTVLIGAQFAVASFLLIAVTVTLLQNAHLRRTGLDAQADPLVVIENTASQTKVETETLRAELLRVPQVKSVTEIAAPPWVNLSGTLVAKTADPNAPTPLVLNNAIGFDFFEVFDIDVLAGRVFSREYGDKPATPPDSSSDDGPDESSSEAEAEKPAPPELIVVDRAFAAWLGFESPEAAVGELVYLPERMVGAFGGKSASALQIIGVVENRVFTFFDAMGTTATMYRLMPRLTYQVARVSRDDVAGGLDGIDRAWRALAPNVAISRRFLDDYFGEVYEGYLRTGQMFSGLAALAFAISVTGLFGMATLIAGRRMREIGVRKAHGATESRMVGMLLASFSKPVIAANVIVWPLTYIAARTYLDSFLAPIALTPLPFVLSLAVTLLIAWLAVGSQTLRAARARPAQVLRYE
jgi:putative ABC transport system permease protein